MTKYVLVRHGEPTYKEVINAGFKGHGLALAPLTKKGIQKVKKTAKNEVFKNSDILISSPYTRAMQTASIIAKENGLDINVEVLLHEWIVDLNNNYNTEEQFLQNIKKAKDEWEQKQINPNFKYSDDIEALENVRNRALKVLSKYTDYNKVIVVCHGLLISMLFKEKIRLSTGDFIIITDKELNNNFKLKQYKR